MNRATVIIGAGYGDEGKGLATDFLASQYDEDVMVVRFNGGAQAGHTVVTPDGERHIFSHFGSGTFAGAATFLSRFFVCHPMLFHRELHQLEARGIRPRVLVDPSAPVTTPYDVMINQQLESARGNARHGSCGIGFGETIERAENSPFTLTAGDLLQPQRLRERLNDIRHIYLPQRLDTLGLPPLDRNLTGEEILEHYMEDARTFAARVNIAGIDAVRRSTLIFEGAQGLMLDMDYGHFPHVTRSNTGLHNVVALTNEARVTELDVIYATRAYVTRHGAGPLAHEHEEQPWSGISDPTNIANTWQGALRFGWLDLDVLQDAVAADRQIATDRVRSSSLLMSCLDQTHQPITFIQGGEEQHAGVKELPGLVASAISAQGVLNAFGPTRNDVAWATPLSNAA